ncbi:hypothetical protein D6745_03220 [Candidatus Woesearchaeota archaeon]|nr:MAG: hypothetical protein D6745_03220 [Candidatus Woesearchaeota archaeon]
MSSQITTAFVKQYSAEVFHLSQQQGSRLAPLVRNESQKGESAFYDRIGATTAILKASRHADTPQIDTPHSRRRVTLKDYVWADLIDKEDLRRMLMDPAGDYAKAAAWAMGRAKDDVIIAAADGDAYGGVDGGTVVVHPNSQKLAAVSGGAFVDMNVGLLRGVKKIFDSNDVDESIPRHAAITSSQLESLLSTTEVTSADYNTVRTLVMGEIDTFLGFKFIRTERLLTQVDALSADPTTGIVGTGSSIVGQRRCIFWAQDGLLLATAEDIMTEIERRPDKNYSTQVYVSMGIGATRMEEEKVVIGFCKEA